MKVLVINGSPKGDYSVTLQTVKYIEHFYPTRIFIGKLNLSRDFQYGMMNK